ncbi:acetyltransferase [Noviherbaspirillum sp.]|uniref:acetyltransferase n=1 Tax=Noviherbaspirillum sp. TaxID=1926288 RepID=UPI0025E854B5|nr:acetyltransferase [Noviherbaspirillum sp.]
MRRLAILGGGGHGKVVADAAEACRRWDDIVFYDDAWPQRVENGPWPYVGSIHAFMQLPPDSCDVVVAIGDNALRARIAFQLQDAGFSLVNVIHPASTVSRHASIGAGSVVFAGAVINIGATLGPACIINTCAIVEHDCVLGTAVHVSPGANLAGEVCIGDASWVGIGACIRQQITVGSKVMIGAGAVVVSAVPDGVTMVGNPARIMQRKETDHREETNHAEYPVPPVAKLHK